MKALIPMAVSAMRNIISVLITRKMIVWTLRRLAKRYDNMITLHLVNLVDAALDNDKQRMRWAAEDLWDHVLNVDEPAP